MLKRACPAATIVGLDPDAEALEIARNKAQQAGLDIELCRGTALEPPLEEGSFDRIVSSLVFHHLTTPEKRGALRAARRLLKRDGELHIADWGKAQNFAMRISFIAVQVLDGFESTAANVRGHLPDFIADAGFISVTETHREMTVFGTLSLYSARVP